MSKSAKIAMKRRSRELQRWSTTKRVRGEHGMVDIEIPPRCVGPTHEVTVKKLVPIELKQLKKLRRKNPDQPTHELVEETEKFFRSEIVKRFGKHHPRTVAIREAQKRVGLYAQGSKRYRHPLERRMARELRLAEAREAFVELCRLVHRSRGAHERIVVDPIAGGVWRA